MEEDATEDSVTNPTLHTKDWSKTSEGVEEYLLIFRGVNGTPLPYVAMKQLLPMAESDDTSNG